MQVWTVICLPERVCIKQKKDGVIMQGPSSSKGALHPSHSTTERKHLKWMGYPSVTAGLAGCLSNMRLCRQLLHKQCFCHWNIAHAPTGCSNASFKKLCDSRSQVLTHQNIQHSFISHTTLGLIKGQPTKDSWGHWLDSTDQPSDPARQCELWQSVSLLPNGFPLKRRRNKRSFLMTLKRTCSQGGY